MNEVLWETPIAIFTTWRWLASITHHGTEVRGNGFAFRVTLEGWVTLEEYMEKAREMLEPTLEQDHVPPEAFRPAIQVACYEGWSDEQLDPIIDRAMIQAPTYSLIWKAACFSKLPRWGGMPGDSETLAARVRRVLLSR